MTAEAKLAAFHQRLSAYEQSRARWRALADKPRLHQDDDRRYYQAFSEYQKAAISFAEWAREYFAERTP